MANSWRNNANSDRLYFLGSKIIVDGDCSHEIKRHLLLGRKAMTNLDSVLKSRDNTFPTKVHIVARVTGRKARGLQIEEIGCKFTFLLRGRRKQTTVRFFFPSLYKVKKRFLKILCCHEDTWLHLNLTFLKP